MMLYPKPNHKRRVPKRGTRTRITPKARKEVYDRVGDYPYCECCGRSQAYAFEVAHLIQASQGGSGDDPANLALLCGPSTNSNTCHHFADYTAKGREWRMQKRKELIKYYEQKRATGQTK